jgi:hypothetical protein
MHVLRVDTSAFPTEGCTVRGRSALVRLVCRLYFGGGCLFYLI